MVLAGTVSSRFLSFHSVELRVRTEPFTHGKEFQWGFFGFVLWFFWYFILQTMRENYIFPPAPTCAVDIPEPQGLRHPTPPTPGTRVQKLEIFFSDFFASSASS